MCCGLMLMVVVMRFVRIWLLLLIELLFYEIDLGLFLNVVSK